MSALLQQSIFRAKFDEKSHVFWDVDFEWILGRFWEAQIRDFRIFFDDFSKQILKSVLEGEKIEKMTNKDDKAQILGPARRNVRSPGETQTLINAGERHWN